MFKLCENRTEEFINSYVLMILCDYFDLVACQLFLAEVG